MALYEEAFWEPPKKYKSPFFLSFFFLSVSLSFLEFVRLYNINCILILFDIRTTIITVLLLGLATMSQRAYLLISTAMYTIGEKSL